MSEPRPYHSDWHRCEKCGDIFCCADGHRLGHWDYIDHPILCGARECGASAWARYLDDRKAGKAR